jgi:aryl-alcohol dehydrogenase-like predicted oxidoreductase
MLEHAVPTGLWDAIMVKYGILNQTADDALFPLCIEHDVGVLNMATIRVALATPDALTKLVGEWTEKGHLKPGVLPEGDPLGWLTDDSTPDVIAAGYKFGAAPRAVSTVLTGTSHLEHLKDNVEAVLGPPLPEEKMSRLAEVFGGIADGGV